MFSDLCVKGMCRYLTSFSRTTFIQTRLNSAGTMIDQEIQPIESDKDFGVTSFLCNHKGFSGVLRHRFSDFLVHEISSDKQTVCLTNLGLCEKTMLHFFKLTRFFRKNDTNILIGMLEGTIVKEHEVDVSPLCNEEIDDLCQTLQKIGRNLEVYKKLTDLGNVIVLNTCRNKANTYTNFVLYKENIASLDALQIIANFLKIQIGDLCIAGMKDKRAITCQRVSARNVTLERLMNLNDKLRGMKIGNIHYSDKPLRFGNIHGNHFTIIIRDINCDIPTVKEAVENFTTKGFINYYGLQRFGKNDLPLHAIGKKMLSRDWQSSVEMIIKPSRHAVKQDVLKCRELWWETRDSSAALRCLQTKNNRLGFLLRGLVAHNNNFEKALEWIPFNVRRLYVHSYCSYIWNVIVSKRITELGTSPILGDLVVPSVDKLISKKNDHLPVSIVDQEMLQTNYVNMYDVVLPLPGYNMQLPQNVVGSWYHELLENDGLSISSFQCESIGISINAVYRHILRKPENVKWSIMKYGNPDADLLDCDYVKLVGKQQLKEDSGDRRALLFEFSLRSSSYATSALREIMQTCITQLS